MLYCYPDNDIVAVEFKNVNYEEEYRYLREWHIALLSRDLKPAVLLGDYVFVDEEGKPIVDEATRAPDRCV